VFFCLLMIDQIMTPPPPEFAVGLQAMQAKETWKATRQALYDSWMAGSDNKAVEDLIYSFGGFGHSMWSSPVVLLRRPNENSAHRCVAWK
jgi:hypothetical protein